jgi:hypothetical protein
MHIGCMGVDLVLGCLEDEAKGKMAPPAMRQDSSSFWGTQECPHKDWSSRDLSWASPVAPNLVSWGSGQGPLRGASI